MRRAAATPQEHTIGAYPSAKLAAEATFAYLSAAFSEGLADLEDLDAADSRLPSNAIVSSKNQPGFQGVGKSARSGQWEVRRRLSNGE